jgi:hypothetical protein
MNIRWRQRLLALGALLLCTASASAADYATVNLSISVDKPADVVWKKVGGYCDIAAWLKLTCVYTSGNGELGTVRRLADRIDEVMVGKTDHSYTYTQPNATNLYHGTMQVVADGKKKSKILYNLIYDQAPLGTDEAKAKAKDNYTTRFNTALESMKKLAEGG